MAVIRIKLEIFCKMFGIAPGTYLYLLSSLFVRLLTLTTITTISRLLKRQYTIRAAQLTFLSTSYVPGTIQRTL